MDILEIKPKSEEIVHFYVTLFEVLNVFLMKTAMFCFDKLCFLLAVWDILK